jgi:hypothetical protein
VLVFLFTDIEGSTRLWEEHTADLDRARELIYEAQLMLANDRPYLCLFYKQTIDLARDNLIFPYTETLGGLEFASGLQSSVVPVSR